MRGYVATQCANPYLASGPIQACKVLQDQLIADVIA
jgi:hypothetical protein